MSCKLPINIEDLLRQRKVEGDRIEYKAGWNPDPTLCTLCAFDDRYNLTATTDDLSPRLMEEFLREVGSDLADEARELSVRALGRQMNVAGGSTEAAMPKNVGLLFFNQRPGRFFPATQIDVVWFPEGADGDRFDEKTLMLKDEKQWLAVAGV